MIEPTSPTQIPAFRLIWISRLCAVVATTGMVVILGYQIYDIARSVHGMSIVDASFLLGLLGLAQFVPYALLSPVSGVVADRFDRRRVALMATILDFAIALALAIATFSDTSSLTLLFALAAAHGAARVFLGPSLGALVPNLVPERLLPRAVALSSTAWQFGALAGPTVAGLLYGGADWMPYALSTSLLVVSCTALFSIGPVPQALSDRETHPIRQFIEGYRFLRGHRFLLGCVTLDLFAVLMGGATALLPVFARDILHVGPEGLGLMRAMPGAGAAVVAFILSWRPIEREVGTKMLLGVAAYGAATVGFGLSTNFFLSLACLAALGAADMISVFIRSALQQLSTPDEMRGRVGAISGLFISASNELGEMQSGVAAALLHSAVAAVVFGGAGAIVVTLVWAVIFPELRNARTFAPQTREKEQVA
ncbi:MFS transporter [Novosphingobium sp. TH158]|uniref:MFS transporter n=1 Tax=Novosphingobium sp. TH158 TaxID=2067455 RepID=UPI000C7B5EC1|nr:MFS transporter [Novosphingobium sp. TH158]PLK25920.1 MFS transporter [Novosphingobium sp. TH158]